MGQLSEDGLYMLNRLWNISGLVVFPENHRWGAVLVPTLEPNGANEGVQKEKIEHELLNHLADSGKIIRRVQPPSEDDVEAGTSLYASGVSNLVYKNGEINLVNSGKRSELNEDHVQYLRSLELNRLKRMRMEAVRKRRANVVKTQNNVKKKVKRRNGRGRKRRCGKCPGCLTKPCGKCRTCINKRMKQACLLRKCHSPILPKDQLGQPPARAKSVYDMSFSWNFEGRSSQAQQARPVQPLESDDTSQPRLDKTPEPAAHGHPATDK